MNAKEFKPVWNPETKLWDVETVVIVTMAKDLESYEAAAAECEKFQWENDLINDLLKKEDF